MDLRAELVHLIHDATPPHEIVRFFTLQGLGRPAIDALLHECGVQFRTHERHEDGISEERRLYLQELSTRRD